MKFLQINFHGFLAYSALSADVLSSSKISFLLIDDIDCRFNKCLGRGPQLILPYYLSGIKQMTT